MKRIEVIYGGQQFSIGNRVYDEVKEELLAGMADGPAWFRVTVGEGGDARADLLISSAIPIALIPIADESPAPLV